MSHNKARKAWLLATIFYLPWRRILPQRKTSHMSKRQRLFTYKSLTSINYSEKKLFSIKIKGNLFLTQWITPFTSTGWSAFNKSSTDVQYGTTSYTWRSVYLSRLFLTYYVMPLYLHPNKVLATSPILLSTAFHDLLSYRSQESESAGTLEAGMSGTYTCVVVILWYEFVCSRRTRCEIFTPMRGVR